MRDRSEVTLFAFFVILLERAGPSGNAQQKSDMREGDDRLLLIETCGVFARVGRLLRKRLPFDALLHLVSRVFDTPTR